MYVTAATDIPPSQVRKLVVPLEFAKMERIHKLPLRLPRN